MVGNTWQLDVYRYGLLGAGCSVCSRVLGFPSTYVLTNIPLTGFPNVCILVTLSGDHVVIGTVQPKLAGHPHFPYGYTTLGYVPW